MAPTPPKNTSRDHGYARKRKTLNAPHIHSFAESIRRLGLIQAVLLVIASPMLGPRPVFAGLEAEPSEVIEQVGKVVDVGTESLGKLYETQPKLFENLKDTVTALKVVDHMANARDSEALAELAGWRIGKQLDARLRKILPSPAVVRPVVGQDLSWGVGTRP
jgi:hypothetical protein